MSFSEGSAGSFSEGGSSEVDYETLHGRNWPSVTQFSVFLENRVGQLLEVLRAFHGSKVKIVGLTDARIPWPKGRSGKCARHVIALYGDLAEAVKRESAQAGLGLIPFGFSSDKDTR